MTEKDIFSGKTELIDRARGGWYESLKDDRMEWEDLTESCSVNEFLEKMKVVPLYRYIVNYLVFVHYRDEIAPEITDETLEILIRKIQAEYKKNGIPGKLCTPRHIREILTAEWSREWDSFEHAGTWRIFELAMGLNLPVQDVEHFLKKAVKRAGFNYYDREELLMYCVLRYQNGQRFACYEALKRDYKRIRPKKAENGFYSEEGTGKVQDRLELIMEGPVYREDRFEYEYLNPHLEEFLAEHKTAAVPSRTAARVFMELYRKFVEEHRDEILDFKRLFHGDEGFAETVLRIVYDGTKTIVLPKHTAFYAENKKKKEREKIYFFTTGEIRLPACETRMVSIPIRTCEMYRIEKEKKQTQGYIGKKEELTVQDSAAKQMLKEVQTATTVKYTGKAGDLGYGSGNLSARAKVGVKIPKGTRFCYRSRTYESTEEVDTRASAEIIVRCGSPGEEKDGITGTDTIRYMEKPVPGILEVTNPKPVKMKVPTNTISTELFREYLYRNTAEKLETSEQLIDRELLGRWFTETEITSVRFTKIRRQAGKNERVTQKGLQKNEVKRSDIITLAFLCFCMDDSMSVSWRMETNAEMVYQDFLLEVNELLDECRMMPFYLENPYECLLAYLIQTDSPADSLRNLWKIVHSGRRNQ